ncbi:MAG: hypothetical protein ACPL3C_06865 [Pyrobaculum sp.]|uniref:hypothetical protein n=1 Tax=Pyrobaculum sp. TaxID=2004705 RepID=UPI003CAC7B04
MIIIRLGALRVAPRSRFRLVAALGVSLVTAFAEVGRLDGVKFCRWESHPEVVHVRCSEVDAEPSLDAVDRIAEVLQVGGVTAVLRGRLGDAELRVEVDFYNAPHLPVGLGMTDEPVDVLAEFEGYVGEDKVDAFPHLIDAEPEAARRFVDVLMGQLALAEVRAATPYGVRALTALGAASVVKASRNYSLRLHNAVPLWYRPWGRALAGDLYREVSKEHRRLAWVHGVYKAVHAASAELLEVLKRYYYVRPVHSVGGLALYPRAASPPTESHSRAVAELSVALERALYAASSEGVRKTLQEKGVVWWSDYVKYLAHYFRQELASRLGR